MRIWTLLTVALVWHSMALTQLPLGLIKGLVPPAEVRASHWFLDTLTPMAYHAKDGEWKKVTSDSVIDVTLCKGWILLKTKSGASLWNSGGVIMPNVFNCICSDSMRFVLYPNGVICYDLQDQEILRTNCIDRDRWKIDTLLSTAAVCASIAHQRMPRWVPCQEIHEWGMYGGSGRWLIPPIFDGPFHFQNGMAEVLYYGQQRKINEKGAFVE